MGQKATMEVVRRLSVPAAAQFAPAPPPARATTSPTDPPSSPATYASSGFAFHTGPEKDAHIIIDLQAPCQLKALRITNRNNNTERAATLTVWTSTDRTQWQKIWQAEKARPVWEILTNPPVTARYLKVGLDSPTPTYLHLRAVDAFGTRP